MFMLLITHQLEKENKNLLATYYIYDIVKLIKIKKIKNNFKKTNPNSFSPAADASVNSSLDKPNSILNQF